RTCLFKLQLPDVRKQLVVDPGFRCHLTEYTRTTADAPSPFVARLRKFIKTRRVTAVAQVGTDRVLHLELSDGLYHLFFEFFAAGNIVLTDREHTVVALLRPVPAAQAQEPLRVGLKYDVAAKQNAQGLRPVSGDRLRQALRTVAAALAAEGDDAPKRKAKKPSDAVRRALSVEFPEFPPVLLEHAFCVVGFGGSRTPEQVLGDAALLDQLHAVLVVADELTRLLSSAPNVPGFIICKRAAGARSDGTAKPLYDDFQPFVPRQFVDDTILEFPTFSKAVDEYFSAVETQKLESKLGEREAVARRKLETARRDHEQRLSALQELQEVHIRKAQAIELNLAQVEEVIASVNSLIAQGMDWVEIARLIEMEQGRQNPVAKLIKLPLKLYQNTVTISLPDGADQADEEDESETESESESSSEDEEASDSAPQLPTSPKQRKHLTIDIDLALSPWANARQYYEQKKIAADKKDKTLKASKKALESHEKKVAADLKRGLKQEKPVLRLTRAPYWFEKFLFFISSDGYLVLG
ncbi:hypothetical protein KEM52_002016, partial [Ascosphaera acerosa]